MSTTRFAADPAVSDLPRSTDGSAVSVALVRTLDALPPQAAALLDAADVQNVFCGRAWYRTVIDHALPPGAEAVFAVCRAGDLVIAIFPLLMQSGRQLQSLTTPYTYTYRPLVPDSISPEMLRLAGEAFGRFCRSWPAVRLEALAPDWPGLELVLAGIRRSGLVIVRFDHFGNWHQTVNGSTWRQYVESRPSVLRKLKRCKEACFDLMCGPEEVDLGIALYESVYRRSWKEPEPFPEFNPALMRAVASLGLLRLCFLRFGTETVAAQFWIVSNRRAVVLKLAHDESFDRLSPGTVLTALMIRNLLEEGIAELDFGRGDDSYKRFWVSERRQRVGILVLNPLKWLGVVEIGRHCLGRGRNWIMSWLAKGRGSGGAA